MDEWMNADMVNISPKWMNQGSFHAIVLPVCISEFIDPCNTIAHTVVIRYTFAHISISHFNFLCVRMCVCVTSSICSMGLTALNTPFMTVYIRSCSTSGANELIDWIAMTTVTNKSLVYSSASIYLLQSLHLFLTSLCEYNYLMFTRLWPSIQAKQ